MGSAIGRFVVVGEPDALNGQWIRREPAAMGAKPVIFRPQKIDLMLGTCDSLNAVARCREMADVVIFPADASREGRGLLGGDNDVRSNLSQFEVDLVAD